MVDGFAPFLPQLFLWLTASHGPHPSCPMLSLSFIWFVFLLGCGENRNSLEDTVREGSFPSTGGWMLESASWEAAWGKKMTTLFLKRVPTCTVSPSHVTIRTPQSQVSCSTKALEQLDSPGLLGPPTYWLCEAERVTLPLSAIFLCTGRNSCTHLLGWYKRTHRFPHFFDSCWERTVSNTVLDSGLLLWTHLSLSSQSSQSNWGDRQTSNWHAIQCPLSGLCEAFGSFWFVLTVLTCSALICITDWGPTFEE